MATVKATIKKRVTGGWDDIHPKTEVDQITDFDANVPAVLNDLTNVNAASPSDGQALVWVAGTQQNPVNKWQPGTVAVDTSNFTTKYTWQPKIVYWDNGGTGAGFRNILKVESATLSTGGILYVDGTSGSVVVNARFEILVNHHQDIVVKSLSSGYTQVKIKVQSSANDEFNVLIARDRNDTVETTITATFIPYDQNATVTTYTNNPAVSHSSVVLTHGTIAFSENITATGGSTGKLYVEGNEVWHAGNAADADDKVSKSGDTMTGNLSFTNTTGIGVQNAAGTAWLRPEDAYGNVHIQAKDTKGIYLDADVFYLRERGNTSNVVLYSNLDNVGIGTTSPNAKLDINGRLNLDTDLIRFRTIGSSSWNTTLQGTSLGKIEWYTDDSSGNGPMPLARIDAINNATSQYLPEAELAFFTAPYNDASPNERMRITSGGNVGIGTTSPSAKLDVAGSARFDGPVNVETNSTSARAFYVSRVGTTQALRFYTTDNVSYIDTIQDENTGIYGSLAISADMEAPDSYISLTGNTVRLNGNVGIGTTSPDSALTVNGGTSNTPARFISTDANTNIALIDNSGAALVNGLGGALTFLTGYDANISGGSEKMRIETGGNVGIGTTSPGNKLTVAGNIDSSGIEIGTAQYAQAIDSKSNYLLLQRDQTVPVEIWGSAIQSRSVHRFFTTAQIDTEINFLRGGTEYSNYIRAQNYPSRGYTGATQKYWIEYGSKGGHHFVVDTDGGTTGATNSFDNFTVFKGVVDGPTLFQVNNGGNTFVAGNLDVAGSIYDNDGTLLRIIKPKGGSYSGGSSHTGAIGITLPAGTRGSATMMSMFIDVYDYAGSSDGESWTIQVGGYNYTGSQWYNVFANLVSGRPDRFFTVRFSHDSGSNTETIWIGENNSSWSYPQIQVRDVLIGHSGDTDADWHNNAFNVTIGTIIGSVTMSKTAENYASDSLRLSGYVPTENAAANSIAKRNGDGDLTVTDLFANGAVYANSNKLAWVKNGSTLQAGVTFSLQSGVLYINTSLT